MGANVPAGYAMLATALENDEALAKSFFANLSVLAYGGATLPDDLYQRMPNVAACRQLAGDGEAKLAVADLIAHPAVVGALKNGLAKMNAERSGSSTRVGRVMLMAEPPSVDGHEITDKGYINQRATLNRRRALAEELYAGGKGVLEIEPVLP
jgi:hypothetical protein